MILMVLESSLPISHSGALTKIIFMTFCCIAERSTEKTREKVMTGLNLLSQKEIVLKLELATQQ